MEKRGRNEGKCRKYSRLSSDDLASNIGIPDGFLVHCGLFIVLYDALVSNRDNTMHLHVRFYPWAHAISIHLEVC
jgi:hypothetical protein